MSPRARGGRARRRGGRVVAAAAALIALAGCPRSGARAAIDAAGAGARGRDAGATAAADPARRGRDAQAGARGADAAVVRFEPRWACRLTGPGRAGRLPHMPVPPARPFADPRSIADAVPLREGVTLAREPVYGPDGGLVVGRATVERRDASDAAVATRAYDVPPGVVEMLFQDAQGAGAAFMTASRVVGVRIGGSGAPEDLAEVSGDVTRPCDGPARDGLRLWPIAPRAWEFPPVRGTPPLVADARWTLSRDARGVCVSRLEGEGPWGRVWVEATAQGMRGELSLDESVNPVACAPVTGTNP